MGRELARCSDARFIAVLGVACEAGRNEAFETRLGALLTGFPAVAEREGLSDPSPASPAYQRELARVYLFKKTLPPGTGFAFENEIIGGAMGMSMASSVDPHSGSHSPALGQYFAVVLTVVGFYLAFSKSIPFKGDGYQIKAVFQDGRRVGFVGTLCHHLDVGGSSPGSYGSSATEIFQEGLRIPPLKLFEAGRDEDAAADRAADGYG